MNNNDDLISRAALQHEMYEEAFLKDGGMQKWDSGCWIRYKLFERVLDRQPAAQPDIIRCKDCKYRERIEASGKFTRERYYCGYEYERCDPYEMTRTASDPDYFCGDAKRREKNDGI